MCKWLLPMLIALVLTACGTPRADSPDAITTWRTTVEDHVHRISAAGDEMGVHMRRYYQDDAARAHTDQALTEIQHIHQQLAAMTPPPSRQALHTLVLDATKDCSSAMDSYRAAFANNNTNEDAPKGYALLQRCVAKLDQLRKKDLDM